MRTATLRLEDMKTTIINMGYVGENEHKQIRFDGKKMFQEYPNASVSLTVCPACGEAYPATIERDGDFVLWTITDSDLVAEGYGEIQLTFTESPHIAKSYICRTKVLRSLVPTGDIPSGLDDFITRAGELLEQVEDTFPAGGTTGQVLAKKSNADYDTEWVDQEAGTVDYTDLTNKPQIGGVTLTGNKSLHDLGAATEEAVSAKYTKPSGGIPASDIASGVIPVLTDLIDDTAGDGDTDKVWSADKSSALLTEIANVDNIAVVRDETEKAYYHDANIQAVSFYPESRVPDEPCRYVNSPNLVEGKYSTGTYSGVNRVKSGRFLNLTGTATGGTVFINFDDSTSLNKLKGKTVNIYVYLKKSTAWEKGSYFKVYDGVSTIVRQNYSKNSETFIGWSAFTNVTIADNATAFMVRLDDGGCVFTSGDFIWIGVYESQAVNTEHVIEGEDPYTVSLSGVDYVDTMIHASTAEIIVPTKSYVDEHTPDIIGYWNDNVYAMPEKFGAVGDGVTDDTQAILDCITYAIQKGKAVKGYGKYKTTSTIVLSADGLDVFLKEVVYTGASSAIQISGKYINFGFDKIQSSGSGIGFVVVNNASCTRNNVEGICLDCSGNAIFTDGLTYYATIRIREVKSSNGNIIEFGIANGISAEYVFYDFTCTCPNGYVAKSPTSAKFYNFTVEGNCKNGLYSPSKCECYGWRHREFIDRYASRIGDTQSTYENGSLIEFADISDSIVYISCDYIYPFSVNTDALTKNDDYNDADLWWTASNNMTKIMCDVVMPYNAYNDKAMPKIAKEVKVINGCKVFVPMHDLVVDVDTATFSNQYLDTNVINTIRSATKQMMATIFNVTTDTEISLSASYNAIGYNKFEVHTNGHDVIIKDSSNNKIFDSSDYQGNDFVLTCVPQYGNTGLYTNRMGYGYWVYDGTNHEWVVRAIS